jgi:hypothetical protein
MIMNVLARNSLRAKVHRPAVAIVRRSDGDKHYRRLSKARGNNGIGHYERDIVAR